MSQVIQQEALQRSGEASLEVFCDLPTCRAHIARPKRGQRYCSSRCRTADWERLHPRLGRPGPALTAVPVRPMVRQGRTLDRVLAMLSDGKWWTLSDLAVMVAAPETTVSARLRDLRKSRYGKFTVERESEGKRLYRYRVVLR